MTQASAFLNLVGSLLVFYAFQTGSSPFMLHTTGFRSEAALCIGNPPRALMAQGPNGEFEVGLSGIEKNCSKGKPITVVNTDSPWLVKIGWGMVLLGFLLQWLSIDPPPLDSEEIREVKKLRKLIAKA